MNTKCMTNKQNKIIEQDVSNISSGISLMASFIPNEQELFANFSRNIPNNLKEFEDRLTGKILENINALDQHKWSLLHYAAARDNDSAIKLIVKKGGNVNVVGDDGRTPLFISVILGSVKATKALVELGANVNLRDNDGDHLLYHAEISGNKKINEILNLEARKKIIDIYTNPKFEDYYKKIIKKVIKESELDY